MPDETLLQRIQFLEADNDRLRRSLERRGETAGLRHQVRNTVAMVRGIVRQSAERFEGAEDYAAHLEARLDAVYRIQNTIANRPFDGVALDAIVSNEMLAHATHEGERLSIAGPEVLLQPAAAGAVALAIHELAINAIKFGALSGPGGQVAVNWTVATADEQSRLTLRWVESGVPEPRSLRRGFGTDVVENALRHQIGAAGRLEFAPGGVRCTIEIPLTAWTGKLDPAPGGGRAGEG